MSYLIPDPPVLQCQCSLEDWMDYLYAIQKWWARLLAEGKYNMEALAHRVNAQITAAFKQTPRELQPRITELLKKM